MLLKINFFFINLWLCDSLTFYTNYVNNFFQFCPISLNPSVCAIPIQTKWATCTTATIYDFLKLLVWSGSLPWASPTKRWKNQVYGFQWQQPASILKILLILMTRCG